MIRRWWHPKIRTTCCYCDECAPPRHLCAILPRWSDVRRCGRTPAQRRCAEPPTAVSTLARLPRGSEPASRMPPETPCRSLGRRKARDLAAQSKNQSRWDQRQTPTCYRCEQLVGARAVASTRQRRSRRLHPKALQDRAHSQFGIGQACLAELHPRARNHVKP